MSLVGRFSVNGRRSQVWRMVAGCDPWWPSPVAVEGRIDAGAFTNSGAWPPGRRRQRWPRRGLG